MPACRNCHKFDAKLELCTAVSEDTSPLRACLKALLEKECAQVRGHVLEIGCGNWDFARQLLEENGCEWLCLDPALIDKKGRRSIATHQGVVSSLPFPDDFFDYVLGNQTMEHWREYHTSYFDALNEIYRVLKPGCILSLNVPIHLHGDKIFIQGDKKAILELFSNSLWTDVSYESWRKDYEPLKAYKGWTLCGYPDTMIAGSTQSKPSSWLMQIRARKPFQTNYQYIDRKTKAKYVWLKYQSILGRGNILDVGADECHLKRYVKNSGAYWGIGLGNHPDQLVDLENEKLPFPDNSFDCVLCLDVLEHLENIHEVFDECCRVTRRFLIVSLPNPWAVFFRMLRFGDYHSEQPLKFYGLPLNPPGDRHKWFFSYEESERFVLYRAGKNKMKVIQKDTETVSSEGRGLRSIVRTFARSFLLRRDLNLKNLYTGTLWVLLEKRNHGKDFS